MGVRAATIHDLDNLARLFDAYRVWYRKASDPEGAKAFLSERLTNKDSEIFVCQDDELLVGFVQLYPLFSSTRMRKAWLLNDLFVAENHRGKGLSVQLIERAKQCVRESGAFGMYLETEKTNDIGNQLYPRTGFKLNDYANYYEWTVE